VYILYDHGGVFVRTDLPPHSIFHRADMAIKYGSIRNLQFLSNKCAAVCEHDRNYNHANFIVRNVKRARYLRLIAFRVSLCERSEHDRVWYDLDDISCGVHGIP
jgi:hypothetical protein